MSQEKTRNRVFLMRWSIWHIFICLLGAVLVTAVSDDHALAKSYTFPLVEIASQVNSDGSLWITERRTYEFSGAFSWATWFTSPTACASVAVRVRPVRISSAATWGGT